MQHVILGAGPAGVIAAETIRKHAPADRIVLVGDEPEAPYSRMAIPYLLIGHIGEEGTHLRHTAGHFEALRIERRQGRALVFRQCVHWDPFEGLREGRGPAGSPPGLSTRASDRHSCSGFQGVAVMPQWPGGFS